MTESSKEEIINEDQQNEISFGEMSTLISRVRDFTAQYSGDIKSFSDPYDLSVMERDYNFMPRKKGKPEMILAEDSFVELGHPATASQAIVLMTYESDILDHKKISILGPDIPQMKEGERYSFAQIVLLSINPGNEPRNEQ